MRLLLDENLSPRAAVDLRRDGFDVVHLGERGGLGRRDREVLDLAFDEDRVLVTANVGDDTQVEVLRRALAALTNEPELVNRALVVDPDGGLRIEDLPTLPA